MAMPRARGGTSPSTRWSPMWISPDVGRSRPAIIRSRVVLPEPEEPSNTRNSPSRIERLTPSTACRSPKCLRRFRMSMPATVPAATGWWCTRHRHGNNPRGRRARATRRTRSPPGPGATPRRSTAPSRARRLRWPRPPGTARTATPRSGPDRGPRRRPARAAPASSSSRSHPAWCRACGAAASPPMRRARRAARRTRPPGARSRLTLAERSPPTSPDLHQPPPTTHRRLLPDAGLDQIARSLRPLVPALPRRDVEPDRGQVIDQNRPGREWPYRGHGFEVALACVADLDLGRLLTRLGRQIAELVVVRLAAVDAAKLGNRPSRAAAAAAQLALALEARVLGDDRPRPAHRAVTLPPRGWPLGAEAAGARLQQGQHGDLAGDAEGRRVGARRPGERVDARVVVTERRFEQCDRVDPPRLRGDGQGEEAAHPAPGRASVQRYPSMEQEGSLEGSFRCAPGRDGLPGGAVLALTQRRLEQPEPRCRLGCLLAGFGDALLKLYVPRSPKTAVGPEHFTFTVRQGVR